MKHRLLSALFMILPCAFATAASYYVSPQGDDADAGTLGQPWRTIQHAANSLAPGDTVYVHAGVYNEAVTVNVSGSQAGGNVTFANFQNETPVVDGSALTPATDDYSALFFIRDHSYIVIQGFEIRNFAATQGDGAPSGIHVDGASHDIQLRNNNVHHIAYDTADGNAFGISIYGTSKKQALTNVVIDGNDVHDLRTGNSESVTLNGNVTNFQVTNNRVHDNDNIGIDFIGFEKTCPDAKLDQARDGVCRGNVVWNITSATNPAYHGDTSADGIYVDGGARVLVERNVISRCDYGAEMTSEHKRRVANRCIFRDNFVSRCLHAGLSLGGYDARHTGGTVRCTVTNNTFFQNNTSDDGSGEMLFQYRVSACTIKNNIFAAGAQALLIANDTPPRNTSGNVFDYNLYFSPAGADASVWTWRGREHDGFAAWKNANKHDAHSLFADPQFVDATTPDLHLQPGSPAVDAGEPAFAPGYGELDIDGGPRVNGKAVDIGADEL